MAKSGNIQCDYTIPVRMSTILVRCNFEIKILRQLRVLLETNQNVRVSYRSNLVIIFNLAAS